jgi:hypothetical protein
MNNHWRDLLTERWALLLLLALLVIFSLQSLNASLDEAAYAYPREVIKYGLADARSDADVLGKIQQWKHDAWGAQIGALRVLCSRDRHFVDSLTTQSSNGICRLVM